MDIISLITLPALLKPNVDVNLDQRILTVKLGEIGRMTVSLERQKDPTDLQVPIYDVAGTLG